MTSFRSVFRYSFHALRLSWRTVFVLLVMLPPLAKADDWPQWLGPKRDAEWREGGIVDQLGEAGPRLRWKSTIGGGYSGPAVARGRVFVMDRITSVTNPDEGELVDPSPPQNTNFVRRRLPGTERVVCLDEKDGRELWTYEHDCPYTMAATYANGPRVTVSVDGDHVYSLGAEGHLACLEFATGKVVWKKELRKQYDLETPIWGFASHPLIDGNMLYSMVGGKGSTVVAMDKITGKEKWRSLSADNTGYAPPMIGQFGNQRQLVAWSGNDVAGLDLKSGEVPWTIPAPSTYAMSIGMPTPKNGFIWLMSFSRKSWLVRVSDNGTLADLEWTGDTRHGINGVMNTPFLLGEHAYGCGPDGRYICARISDGKHEWTSLGPLNAKRPIQWGNVFTVKHKDRFFLVNDQGDLTIARMSPEGYEQISQAHLIEPNHKIGRRDVVWSHPAFANKSIYLRNENEIRCYSLAKE